MAEKSKVYRLVKFPPEVFKGAYGVFRKSLPKGSKELCSELYVIRYNNEEWFFDSKEEFYAEYRKEIESADFIRRYRKGFFSFSYYRMYITRVRIELPSRKEVEKTFEVFEENYEKYKIPEEDLKKAIQERVKVFIGHGRSQQWRDLKDHLQEKHGFKVVTYETGVRAGYTIAEVLQEMSEEASMAFLIHTGEDLDKGGILHARENVIHETGLFQGKLGSKRSIVLIEEQCNEFSNILGIQQLRFSKNNIQEVFGEVLAIIYREFGESNGSGS